MFVILTVCVYVSPTGTSTKRTASGVTSIRTRAVIVGSVLAVPIVAVAPPAACVVVGEIANRTRTDLQKLLKFRHLHRSLPTMNVPLNCPPPHKVARFLLNPLLGATGREFTRGTG